jgi:hypothetical protein
MPCANQGDDRSRIVRAARCAHAALLRPYRLSPWCVDRELVLSLLARMRSNQVVAANTAPGSIPFSEAMGFTHDPRVRKPDSITGSSPVTGFFGIVP